MEAKNTKDTVYLGYTGLADEVVVALKAMQARRRITVLMTDEEKAALEVMSLRAYREPYIQLRLILRAEAERQGLLKPLALSGESEGMEEATSAAGK